MSAERPGRRRVTAREGAALLNASPRTVQRIMAEPRADYERRARERGEQILALRAGGLLWREIGERFGISPHAAMLAGRRARERQEAEERARHDAETLPPPLFP